MTTRINIGLSPLAPVVTGFCTKRQEAGPSDRGPDAPDRAAAGGPRHRSTPHPPLPAGDPGFAEAVARLVGMPLDQNASAGAPLEVRVPWHGETLWFVLDDRQAEALVREGVSRGRIWTAGELGELMTLPEPTPEIVQRIALVKREFGGDIVEVRRR